MAGISSNAVTLTVSGRTYAGWEDVAVRRSIEQASGGFELTVSNRWPGQGQPWRIREGDACTLAIGDDVLITGYVDEVESTMDERAHGVRVSGRDRASDLIDCSAIHKPDQWSGITLDRLAAILAAPFGVSVSLETDVGAPIPTAKLQQGETAWEAIERFARMRALLAISDGRGGLVLTRAGKGPSATDAIVEGRNVKGLSLRASAAERFSEYVVKGQRSAAADEDDDAARRVSGRVVDRGVSRYRPMLVLAEGQSDGASAADRAAWEASVRAGRATRGTARLAGWRQSDGSLWPLNGLVKVTSPQLDLDDELLIAEVVNQINVHEGSITELSLARADAYRVLREVPKGKGVGAAASLPDTTQLIVGADYLGGTK